MEIQVFIPASILPRHSPRHPIRCEWCSKLAKIPDSITEGAVAFDGAGDYLVVEHMLILAILGTGDFTVECLVCTHNQ